MAQKKNTFVRIFIAFSLAMLVHLLLFWVDGASPAKNSPATFSVKIIPVPNPPEEKKVEEKKPEVEKPKEEKPKQAPPKKTVPEKKKEEPKKVEKKPQPKLEKPVHVRSAEKKEKVVLTPPKIKKEEKKPLPEEPKKEEPKKEKPKEEKKIEPEERREVAKQPEPEKEPERQPEEKKEEPKKEDSTPEVHIRNLQEYRTYLAQELASTNLEGVYVPPLHAQKGIPLEAMKFFRMKSVVLDRRKIFEQVQKLAVEVDLENGDFTKIQDPKYLEKFYRPIGFVIEKAIPRMYAEISKQYDVATKHLITVALLPQNTGPIFAWKVLKTLQKAGYTAEEVASVDGRFRKIGDVWIFEVKQLILKNAEQSVSVEDFELKMLLSK